MADCNTAIQHVHFDFTDPEITRVRVEIDFAGDCPLQMKRVYEKAFPARIPAVDLLAMEGGVHGYLLW